MLAARDLAELAEDATLGAVNGGATLKAGMGGISFALPFLDGEIVTGGADLSVGGAGLGTISGAGAGLGWGLGGATIGESPFFALPLVAPLPFAPLPFICWVTGAGAGAGTGGGLGTISGVLAA